MRTHSLALLLLAVAAAGPAEAHATTRFLAPGGVDTGPCTEPLTPCASFEYAYTQAGPGDRVLLAGGSYPAQSIPKIAGRSGAPVEFAPQPGAAVSLADLNISGDRVAVSGVESAGVDIGQGGAGVTDVAVIDTRARRAWIQNAHNVLLLGGSYGGNKDSPTLVITGSPASSNVVIYGVDFHDAVATNPSVHMECIWAGGVQGMTVANSIFRNCAYFDIFFTRFNGPDPRNVLLENNVFEETRQPGGGDAPYAVNISDHLSKVDGFTIRNNTVGGDIAIQPAAVTRSRVVANLGVIATCKAGVAYSHNVFTSTRCGTGDKQVSGAMSQFVNPAAHDWRLVQGAAAIDAGDPSDFPATDRFGRPRSGPPDAGAHEYERPAAPPGTYGDALIISGRLGRSRICRRPRPRCRRSTVLNLVLSEASVITVRLQRRLGRRRWRTVRTVRRLAHVGSNPIRIRARGLRRGRYRVVATAATAATAAPPLRRRLRVL